MEGKKLPPSKIKYDATHPIISVRVNLETKQLLDEMKAKSGKTAADVLKEGVGLQLASTKHSFQMGCEKGYREGYEEAATRYMIRYNCAYCGKVIRINTPEDKAILEDRLSKSWMHNECYSKKYSTSYQG